ncbi:hypothetical protein WH96_06495 [Kiloniella spongiae]|uniref:Uncharacterized protein n=1 Tax=Kiloniella spongiae TaxID=1489064 RepID=A0A0H2MFZ7_9PROT|nr:hypothetical protein WH96_06495 [Kiloniella spongiae]
MPARVLSTLGAVNRKGKQGVTKGRKFLHLRLTKVTDNEIILKFKFIKNQEITMCYFLITK